SPNLKSWTHLSDFGPAGSTNGIWECPDLFSVPVEGRRGESRWVLVVNVGSGAPAGGSGTQYFVGEFDGTRFVPDPGTPAGTGLWADFGRDFYAAVSWSDIPARDGRRLWLGWMSNWTYANDVPTFPWRSAMTVPRELRLRSTPSGLRLVQSPVGELTRLRGSREDLGRATLSRAAEWLRSREVPSGLAELELELDSVPSEGAVNLSLNHGTTGETRITANLGAGTLDVDRTRAGRSEFSPAFAGVHRAPLRIVGGKLQLRVLVDVSSLEVFAQNGETVLTDLVLPESSGLQFSLQAEGPATAVHIRSISLWKLQPAGTKLPIVIP
ncbi:MAG: GH32 C-terminal domain-containing protein, partial [Verrucomicrobiales bacterium]|nr:GH32 C-terminal domain-containing protein [Verrucomicrobiales bacterium]